MSIEEEYVDLRHHSARAQSLWARPWQSWARTRTKGRHSRRWAGFRRKTLQGQMRPRGVRLRRRQILDQISMQSRFQMPAIEPHWCLTLRLLVQKLGLRSVALRDLGLRFLVQLPSVKVLGPIALRPRLLGIDNAGRKEQGQRDPGKPHLEYTLYQEGMKTKKSTKVRARPNSTLVFREGACSI